MLRGICKFVILGHSERRQIFGETDLMVNEKIKRPWPRALSPSSAVGETLDENEAGKTGEVLGRQVREGLKGICGAKRWS